MAHALEADLIAVGTTILKVEQEKTGWWWQDTGNDVPFNEVMAKTYYLNILEKEIDHPIGASC